MSWLENNYEKAALGGAAVCAAALAFLGVWKLNGVQSDFASDSEAEEHRDPAVKDAAVVEKAISSRGAQLSWEQPVGPGERGLDLFTGVPLFVHKDTPDQALDLFTAEPIHPPIENKWWIEHRLDPGEEDAPNLDADGDGFTNLEEYIAKTDPASEKDFPPLIGKLRFTEDESVKWSVRPAFPEMNKKDVSGVRLYLEDKTEPESRTKMGSSVKENDILFDDGPMKARFKYLGLTERREMNPRTKVEETKTYARFEDQKPNKKGVVHEFEAPLSESRVWADDVQKFDRSAVFSLEAGTEKGTVQTIPENTRFGLPFSNAKKDYLLKSVTPEAVEVEYTDAKSGETKTVTIPKGEFPNLEAK